MKTGVLYKDFQILDHALRYTNASPNFSQFMHKLEHCSRENAEALHDLWRQSKSKIKRIGIDPNY